MSKRECSVTVYGPRVQSWLCSRAGVVQREGRWYCKQHDPEQVKARRQASDDKYNRVRETELAIEDEADRLAKALGVNGSAEHLWGVPFSQVNRSRRLVISFEDAERLIARLAAQSPSQETV